MVQQSIEALSDSKSRKTLNSKHVMDRTGWSLPTLWRRYEHGTFPKPHYDGRHRIWFEDEVSLWLDAHPQCRAAHHSGQPTIDIDALKREIFAELSEVVSSEVGRAQAKMKAELRAIFAE